MRFNFIRTRTLGCILVAAWLSASPAAQAQPDRTSTAAPPPTPPATATPSDVAGTACGNATITVTSPNGGEIWTAGTTQTVTWTSRCVTGSVDILLYKDGEYRARLGMPPASAGRFDWYVCDALTNGAGYTIFLHCTDECGQYLWDSSDASFTIAGGSPVPTSLTITSPAGGETWVAGSTQTITWTGPGITENVGLVLLRQKDGACFPLGSAPATDGRFDALICPSLADGTDYKLFIHGSDACGKVYNDYSDGRIAIVGSTGSATLTLTSPNGGE
jgi:hypothetical protein